MSAVRELASWAAGLDMGAVPAPVLARARAQRSSVLAAVAASLEDPASRRVLAAVEGWAGDGPAPLPGSARRVRVDDAVYAAAALSVALDFDDYLCFAHTGHSAVLVPSLLASETGAGEDEQLLAQVAASEIEARIGGACLIGPQNGQLWSFVHAAGAAVAAGRLLGLDEESLAQALAIALYQPPRATVPGFMAPDSKLLTAAEPSEMGLRAARLAAAGVTGPLDSLEHEQGFLSAFAYTPLRGMLGGLGRAWATETLCVKPYPGCAYLDTMVDALLELGPPPGEEVDSVVVEASTLTCQMDQMSAAYAAADRPPTPVTVTFSVPWNVAITLVAGELTPRQLRPDWLAANHAELSRLARAVELHHDWALTQRATAQFGRLLPPAALARDAGLWRLLQGMGSVRKDHPSLVRRPADLKGIVALARMDRGAAQRTGGGFWDEDAVAGFAMTFPARVTIRLRDGRTLEASADVPRGGAGHPTEPPEVVAAAKLEAWAPE